MIRKSILQDPAMRLASALDNFDSTVHMHNFENTEMLVQRNNTLHMALSP